MYFWNIIYWTLFREFIDVCCRPTPGSGISSTVGFFANKLNYSSKVKSFSQSTWETWHLWHLWHFATLINMIMTSTLRHDHGHDINMTSSSGASEYTCAGGSSSGDSSHFSLSLSLSFWHFHISKFSLLCLMILFCIFSQSSSLHFKRWWNTCRDVSEFCFKFDQLEPFSSINRASTIACFKKKLIRLWVW